MAEDDRTLLARIAGGDQSALEALAARFHAPLWRFLARQLGSDSALVEDTLQEVYLAVWRSAARYRNEATPATWLFSIARFLAINARKAQARHPTHPLSTTDDTEDRSPARTDLLLPSPEDAVLDRLALADALLQLAPKHQEVLDLVCYHGFALEEVAQILSVPVGTVKSRLSYARRALAAALKKGALP